MRWKVLIGIGLNRISFRTTACQAEYHGEDKKKCLEGPAPDCYKIGCYVMIKRAFSGCSALWEVVLPDTVENIAEDVCAGCECLQPPIVNKK